MTEYAGAPRRISTTAMISFVAWVAWRVSSVYIRHLGHRLEFKLAASKIVTAPLPFLTSPA